ncbi:MAG: oligosaccharide flippase family protein, partial [Verrucomicrobiales bacterium]|nr:oligosaccharide flippase family protein [Verrucomicrobiales bacterium]
MSTLLHRFPMLRSIVSNFGWRMAERIVAVFFSILVGAWVARYLGPDSFGVLAAALAIVGLISVLPFLGLERILVRELVEKPAEEEGAILGTAAVMTSLASVAGLAITAGVIWSFPATNELRWTTLLIASSLIGTPAMVVRAWFEKELQGDRDAVAGILG